MAERNTTLENILSLYQTFLGKFKFFQQFILILVGAVKDIDSITLKTQVITEATDTILDEVQELKNQISELKQQLESFKTPSEAGMPKNFTKDTSVDIMQRKWDAYNQE